MRDLLTLIHVETHAFKSRFLNEEKGQDLIEYALVVALIAFAATAGMSSVATQINTAFGNIGNKISTYVP